jgi:uncharacterized protein (TIGR02145 family)
MNDGNLSGMTIEEFLNSPGYNAPMGYIAINPIILLYLEENGGCSSCINLLKLATNPDTPITTPPDILLALRKKAESGDTESMLNLAWKLIFDYGVTKNEDLNVESSHWIEKAANLDNAETQFELSEIYRNKNSDNSKIFELLEKSAQNGHIGAKHNLATYYLLENKNAEQAFYWMEQASNDGHAGARRKLGLFHIDGIGVSVDKEKGLSLLKEAADLGDEQAKKLWEKNKREFNTVKSDGIEKGGNEQEQIQYLAEVRKRISKYQGCISAGDMHTVGLKTDGTIVSVGDSNYRLSDWRGIVAIAAETFYTVGLKVDGTVVAEGTYSDWDENKTDFVNIEVYGATRDWRNIFAISVGHNHTVGLKTDGTVVAVGSKYDYSIEGQYTIDLKHRYYTDGWRDIVAISAGYSHTVGLKANGTVVAIGDDVTLVVNGKLKKCIYDGQCNVGDWRDIVAISAGRNHTVGLKADGTVVTVGNNKDCQCNVSSWRDIVAISAGANHTVGLKADGTVIATGDNKDCQCNVSDWRDIGYVDKEQLKQKVAWEKQGLCYHCGGKIYGFIFKKCKLCNKPEKAKTTKSIIRLLLIIASVIIGTMVFKSVKKETPVLDAKPTVDELLTEIDGKTYKTVKIGSQTWMAENLNTEKGKSLCYNNDSANCQKYGRYYDWKTAMKVCPSGWHLPSNAEWDAVYRSVDGNSGTSSPYKSETAGKYLKASSGWNPFNEKSGNGEDAYGFAALPGGSNYSGKFNHVGNNGYWWSSSEAEEDKAYYRFMLRESNIAGWNNNSKNLLLNVRCLRD